MSRWMLIRRIYGHLAQLVVVIVDTDTKAAFMTESPRPLFRLAVAVALSLLGSACDSTSVESDVENVEPRAGDEEAGDDGAVLLGAEAPQSCVHEPSERPNFLEELGCLDDFTAVAAIPTDTSIPGVLSVKTVMDRSGGNRVYFQDSSKYSIHWEFTSEHLSGQNLPIVPPLSTFNQQEYYSPDRRFVLGAISYYEGPDEWVYELAPYDTASPQLIAESFEQIRNSSYFGDRLKFHPTSTAQEELAAELTGDVPVLFTSELYAKTDFQALNLGSSVGFLRFLTADELETTFVGFRDIVVLDRVPNDISVVAGIITAEFQTPLSHINVLSQNRGTPNMGLQQAHDNTELLALEGQWVELTVTANGYTIAPATQVQADAWWESNKPEIVAVPSLDLEREELLDLSIAIDPTTAILDQIKALIPAYGGKASHYAALAQVEGVRSPRAFSVPVHYYWDFMEQNGFRERIEALLADSQFNSDPQTRSDALEALRDDMKLAPVDPGFEQAILAKLDAEYSGVRMRFRSSTNAEDLDGFTGAGLYTSKSGDPSDPTAPVMDAIRKVWASVWFFRAFEERSFRGIDHLSVGMALLVHRSFPEEEANGVALTENPFDSSGLEPGFYVNVQLGEESVVKPEPGISTDQFIHHFTLPGQPAVFIARSNLVAAGETVISKSQTNELGKALDAIHKFFRPAYGDREFYAMDVEFKFDQELGQADTEPPVLIVKQARPHPGRGGE